MTSHVFVNSSAPDAGLRLAYSRFQGKGNVLFVGRDCRARSEHALATRLMHDNCRVVAGCPRRTSSGRTVGRLGCTRCAIPILLRLSFPRVDTAESLSLTPVRCAGGHSGPMPANQLAHSNRGNFARRFHCCSRGGLLSFPPDHACKYACWLCDATTRGGGAALFSEQSVLLITLLIQGEH